MARLRAGLATWLLSTVFAGAAGAQVPFEPVTDAELRAPSDGDWLQWRRTYDGW